MNWLFGKFFLRMNLEAGTSIINFTLEHIAFATSRVLTWHINDAKKNDLFSFLD